MRTTFFILLCFLLLFGNAGLQAQENDWAGFGKDSVISSLDGYINRFYYYKATSKEKKPLIVSIHQWSADYQNFKNSMAPEAKQEDWNYIFPDVRGPNNHPKACGSDYLVNDIDQAIEWAVTHLPVDPSAIYIVGASGGGYNALCHFMKSRYPVKAYSVWVPITDLDSWYYESLSRKNKYAKDIVSCLCDSCREYNKEKARERSPLYLETPKDKLETTRLHIYAGVHDGYTGAVPVSHSLRFYNKLLTDWGVDTKAQITSEEMVWILTARSAPYLSKYKIGEREVLYNKSIGNLSISIFEGGHEILVDEVIPELRRQEINPWLWDASVLCDVRKNIQSPLYMDAYRALIQEADQKLKEKNYSVTYKKKTAPNGDKHDYVSLARYWWPDPSKKNGMPYIVRDGESNPELEQYDRIPLHDMSSAVTVLAQAYFFSGDERYAAKAVDILQTWFLNKKTRMNPNLNYSQFVPGRNDSKGSKSGLIDTYCFVEMLNAVRLLENSGAYTEKDREGLKSWFSQLAEWMQISKQGIDERNSVNNHGIAYDVQLTTYLLFSGKRREALKLIRSFPRERLFAQIEPDGSQPNELRRTLGFGYSVYNIRHIVEMFLIAKKEGIALWPSESEDKRSFYKAVEFLIPYLGKDVTEWPYKQISSWDIKQQEFCEDLYRITLFDPSRTDFIELYRKNNRKGPDDRLRLLYGAADAIK